MNDEDDQFVKSLEKSNQFMESLTASQRENIPELMALFTLFCIKELDFERVLKMLRQSVNNFAVAPSYLATWRSCVQAKLKETSKDELGLDDPQLQQLERVLLGLEFL